MKIKEIFYDAIKLRRESGVREDDMLQTLIDTPYKLDVAIILKCF